MERGAWWATVHGAAKSQTLLKRLSMRKKKFFCTTIDTYST